MKVNNQAKFQITHLQIMNDLCWIDRVDRLDRFWFDNQLLVNEEITPRIADNLPLKLQGKRFLALV